MVDRIRIGKEEYLELVDRLDALIDQVGEDESHSSVSQIDKLSALIENYESLYVPELVFS